MFSAYNAWIVLTTKMLALEHSSQMHTVTKWAITNEGDWKADDIRTI